MSNQSKSLYDLVKSDPRYPLEAYIFIHESLNFAADTLELGSASEAEFATDRTTAQTKRHLTGQELCEAIRTYAINQFGYMAKIVLKSWGITSTSGFGDIVYNLISIGRMEKSEEDKRSHFDGVYEFDDVFETDFRISCNSFAERS